MNNRRYIILYVFVGLFVLGIVLRLGQIQLIRGEEYKATSYKRMISLVPVKAPRGEILDRYGRVLVGNRMGFSIQLQKVRRQSDADLNKSIIDISRILEKEGKKIVDSLPISQYPYMFTFDENPNEPQKKEFEWKESRGFSKGASPQEVMDYYINKYGVSSEYDKYDARTIVGVRYEMEVRGFSVSNPFTIASDVSISTVTRIKEQQQSLTNVRIVTEPIREYPYGSLAAHLLGRVGAISKDEYEQYKSKGYSMNDSIGKQGIEKAMEEYLHGRDGIESIEQDLSGVQTNTLNSIAPVPGNNVVLTIDLDVQAAAEKILEETIRAIREKGLASSDGAGADAECGSCVAIDVNTGEVLAMASYPTYDPAKFNENYSSLIDDPRKPMFNRAIAGTYAPGSTFKMLTAIAGLESGVITPTERITDYGVYRYYPNYQPRCWIFSETGRTHGTINVSQALAESCNYFFYETGRRLTIERIVEYAKRFGLGDYTGIELVGEEKSGTLAGPEERKQNNRSWYPGDTLQAAIGQSDNLFTPIQLATYISTIVNGGTRYKTHLVKSINAYDGSKVIKEFQSTVVDKIEMRSETLRAVLDGMRLVASEGTARAAFRGYNIEVGAKTGTAQVPKGTANGVFVAFAPFDNPQIAVAIVVEHAGSGGITAPIAKEIISKYLDTVSSNADLVQNQNTFTR